MKKTTTQKTTLAKAAPEPLKPEHLAQKLDELSKALRQEMQVAVSDITHAELERQRAVRNRDWIEQKHARACQPGLSIEQMQATLLQQPFDKELGMLLARWKCGELKQKGASETFLFESLYAFVARYRYSGNCGATAWLDVRGRLGDGKGDRAIHFYWDRSNNFQVRPAEGDLVAREGGIKLVGDPDADLLKEVRRVMGIPYPKTPLAMALKEAGIMPSVKKASKAKPAAKVAPKAQPEPARPKKKPGPKEGIPYAAETLPLFEVDKFARKGIAAQEAVDKHLAATKDAPAKPRRHVERTKAGNPIPPQGERKQSWYQWANAIGGDIEPIGDALAQYMAGTKPAAAKKYLETKSVNAITDEETRRKVLEEIDQRAPMDRPYAEKTYGTNIITWLVHKGYLMEHQAGDYKGKLDLTGIAGVFLGAVQAASPKAGKEKPAKGKPKSVSLPVRADGPSAEPGPGGAGEGGKGAGLVAGTPVGKEEGEFIELTPKLLGVTIQELVAAMEQYAIHPASPLEPIPADWTPRARRTFVHIDHELVVVRGAHATDHRDFFLQEVFPLSPRQVNEAVRYADRRADCKNDPPEECPLVDVELAVTAAKAPYIFGEDKPLYRVRVANPKKGGGK